VGEELADVVTAAAENGEDHVADRALERAAGKAAVGFHVTYLKLDGAAATGVVSVDRYFMKSLI